MRDPVTKQKITSAGTSLNQIPAIWKCLNDILDRPANYWAVNRRILDYGGGKYDSFTDFLGDMGIENLVYDPFSRSDDHNKLVRKLLRAKPADLAFCSNVLNVIKEPAARHALLEDIRSLVAPGGRVYFTFHEGDKSSRGKRTSKGWQANRPSKNYMREIKRVFPATEESGGYRSSSGIIILTEVPYR